MFRNVLKQFYENPRIIKNEWLAILLIKFVKEIDNQMFVDIFARKKLRSLEFSLKFNENSRYYKNYSLANWVEQVRIIQTRSNRD